MDIMSDFIWRFELTQAFRNVLFHYLRINIFILAVHRTRIKMFTFQFYGLYLYLSKKDVGIGVSLRRGYNLFSNTLRRGYESQHLHRGGVVYIFRFHLKNHPPPTTPNIMTAP